MKTKTNAGVPKVSLFHDTRKPLATGENKGRSPIKIRVTFPLQIDNNIEYERCYFLTGHYLFPAEFEKILQEKDRGDLNLIGIKIRSERARAADIIDTNPRISPDLFKKIFTGKVTSAGNVEALFNEVIKQKKNRHEYKTAWSYESSRESILAFAPSVVLDAIDRDFLFNYEADMLKKGKSITTVAIYLRCLRAVFNLAIQRKLVSRDNYPFGIAGYTIPQSENVKKALVKGSLKSLLDYHFEDHKKEYYLDCWRLSYYLIGMNFIDMANLTEENIQDDNIVYHRSKTKKTKRVKKPIVIPFHKEAQAVLKKYKGEGKYLLHIINDDMTTMEQINAIDWWRKKTVETVNEAAQAVGIKGPIVLYTARHSAATKLVQNGADIATAKELLGHSSITTTERYLKSLDIEEQRKHVAKL